MSSPGLVTVTMGHERVDLCARCAAAVNVALGRVLAEGRAARDRKAIGRLAMDVMPMRSSAAGTLPASLLGRTDAETEAAPVPRLARRNWPRLRR